MGERFVMDYVITARLNVLEYTTFKMKGFISSFEAIDYLRRVYKNSMIYERPEGETNCRIDGTIVKE